MLNWLKGTLDEVNFQVTDFVEKRQSRTEMKKALDTQKEKFLELGIDKDLIDASNEVLLQDEILGLDARSAEQLETMHELSRKLNELF